MYIPTFKMPAIKQVWQLKDVSLLILIDRCQSFLYFVWWSKSYKWNTLPFGLATAPRAFSSLSKPILFLQYNKFSIIIYMGDILVIINSKHAGTIFGAHYWYIMVYTLIFPSLNFAALSAYVFLDHLGMQWIVCISAI